MFVLPFDYCGNLTTAHSVVKVCAADSKAIPSLHDLSGSLVKLVSELSLIFKSVWQAALCQPGFDGRRVKSGVTIPWDPRTS